RDFALQGSGIPLAQRAARGGGQIAPQCGAGWLSRMVSCAPIVNRRLSSQIGSAAKDVPARERPVLGYSRKIAAGDTDAAFATGRKAETTTKVIKIAAAPT